MGRDIGSDLIIRQSVITGQNERLHFAVAYDLWNRSHAVFAPMLGHRHVADGKM